MSELWNRAGDVFAPDGGLLDIVVADTTCADWDALLAALQVWGYPLYWSTDSAECPAFASAAEAFARRQDVSVMLEVEVAGILVHTFFFAEEELELDIEPREVCESNFDALMEWLARVGDLLRRRVSITPESAHERELLAYDPRSRQFTLPAGRAQR